MQFVSVDSLLPVSRSMVHSRFDCDVFGIEIEVINDDGCKVLYLVVFLGGKKTSSGY